MTNLNKFNGERNSLRLGAGAVVVVALLTALGCSTSVLKTGRTKEILKNDEFDKQVEVSELPPDMAVGTSGLYVTLPGPEPVAVRPENSISTAGELPVASAGVPSVPEAKGVASPPLPKEKVSKANKNKNGKGSEGARASGVASEEPPPEVSAVHLPAHEDSEGFTGRRPASDPYRVGEKVVLDVSYFGVSAGKMNLEVKPFVKVNGKPSYHFVGSVQSSSVFSMVYAVDDWFETFVDYNTMIPTSYALHVKESKQLRETRCIFDLKKMQAVFWDKKINSEEQVEERKLEWEIPHFPQNVFTAAFYLRNFKLRPGKKLAFSVAHEKENLLFTGEVVRKEKLSTPIGELNTVVVKPKIELNGVFKPVGDIFIWLTDDDRKLIVRIESKIKIGTIVASVIAIEPGRAPASENVESEIESQPERGTGVSS